jgi:alkylation response protein AidB-like acyl-CoA dehydrogenase
LDFSLTEDQRAIREPARRVAEREVLPRTAAIDRSGVFDRGLYRRMGEIGLTGVAIPEAYEGSRADTLTYGLPFIRQSSQAKVFASDMCMKHVTNAMQVFGGYSYVKGFPIERLYRDAKIHRIWDSTNEIQRAIISRQLLREGIE